eukprot:365707-Chlamydomonas_euryale.AAC.15
MSAKLNWECHGLIGSTKRGGHGPAVDTAADTTDWKNLTFFALNGHERHFDGFQPLCGGQ